MDAAAEDVLEPPHGLRPLTGGGDYAASRAFAQQLKSPIWARNDLCLGGMVSLWDTRLAMYRRRREAAAQSYQALHAVFLCL
jgi:hypothetical protein